MIEKRCFYIIFDVTCNNYYMSYDMNCMVIKNIETTAKKLLEHKGYVTLIQILEMLGVKVRSIPCKTMAWIAKYGDEIEFYIYPKEADSDDVRVAIIGYRELTEEVEL